MVVLVDDATELAADALEALVGLAEGPDGDVPLRIVLLAMEPDHYLLQVLVASSAARARDFVAARADPEAYRWYLPCAPAAGRRATWWSGETIRAGRRRNGRSRASPGRRGLSPWLRRVRAVQDELRCVLRVP